MKLLVNLLVLQGLEKGPEQPAEGNSILATKIVFILTRLSTSAADGAKKCRQIWSFNVKSCFKELYKLNKIKISFIFQASFLIIITEERKTAKTFFLAQNLQLKVLSNGTEGESKVVSFDS